MPNALLTQALNVFAPRGPMPVDKLDDYYVLRPQAPLAAMKAYLLANDQPVKILFSGHRGSGKSTELIRLARDLENEFFVVQFSVATSFNLPDLDYVDIALACAIFLFREASAKARQVKIPAALWKDVYDWLTKEITTETTVAAPKAGAVSAKLNALIFSIEGKYGREAATRKTMRENLHQRINDLLIQANLICEEVYRHTNRRPLIVVEDLDKIDQAAARDLFFNHAATLNSLACPIIYTFPISLVYSNEFTERIGDYHHYFLLPNISLNSRQGEPNEKGRAALAEAVTRRIPAEIFGPGALGEIIGLSGGLMRDLVRLVSDAALLALTEEASVITLAMVKQVAAEMSNSYRRLLLPAHYEELKKAHREKQVSPTETVRQLLENLSLLEYRNGGAWVDVHPAALALL